MKKLAKEVIEIVHSYHFDGDYEDAVKLVANRQKVSIPALKKAVQIEREAINKKMNSPYWKSQIDAHVARLELQAEGY
jgi:chitinase